MFLGSGISIVASSHLGLSVLFLGAFFALLAFYDHFSVKKWKRDIALGKDYFLKDIRALSGAVEHQELSDEFRRAIAVQLSDYERRYLELRI